MHLFLTEGMGWLEVITGSMFSGKSEELIRRLRRAKYANQKVIAFKHSSDKRYDDTKVASHSKNFIEAIPASSAKEIEQLVFEKYYDAEVIGIDEVQFFGLDIVNVVERFANMGKRVIVAGLDQDFRGEPFHPMPELLARAEHTDKLNAICMVCGSPASRTQRLVNGEPAYYDDPIIQVGASESYEARCRKCHVVKHREKKEGKLYFIVGTSTEIGKTFSTISLLKDDLKNNKKVIALKPVETGLETFNSIEESDSGKYAKLLNKNISEINEYFFNKPVSPHLASIADNKTINLNNIKTKINSAINEYDTIYVEGAGGLLVPLKDKFTFLDLIIAYRQKAEVILVSANTLGTINHTLLTIDVLKRNDIKIRGIVFNNVNNIKDEKFLNDNIETIKSFTNLEILKVIDYVIDYKEN
ncbi:MAG: thymidine kinase [Fusobacteriaceae bacterium]|nr:dethiobiotin synthase [Fusobacteriales bacterium]MDN5304208.1 thymidine kinase [Fusobacteriaceae bacterium]